jgi:hypothetical protein
MITNNEYYSDMNEGEDFSLDYYLPSLDTDVILWVKIMGHGSYDPCNDTIDHDPKFKVLGCVDTDDEPVVMSKHEVDKVINWLTKDYWVS